MPTITRLVQGKKNQSRVNLYLDGQFAFALSIDEVVRHSLKKGMSLSDDQIASLKETDESDYLYAKILNFLSYRPRSIKEVRDRLTKYGLVDSVKQNEIIDRLMSKGYLDDLAFARWFVESRNTHRPRSKRMLSQELQSKGISRDVIIAVGTEVADESDTILRLIHKKLGASRPLELVEKQKLYAYLARQGFAWDKIMEVVKSWESE